MSTILETKNLCKFYGAKENEVKAVDKINIEIKEGEFVAIVGKSGSGKSTLLHMLGGLDTPTSGEVLLKGKELYKMKEDELAVFRRRKIGFIFQAFNLVSSINVWENIVLPIGLDGKKVDTEYINDIIETLGIEKKIHNLPNTLSGGQQQRVAIARALASRPDILFADEPTTALDVTIQAQILDLLREIQMKLGTATILVSHDLGVVARVADRVAVMYAGKIVESGTVEDVFYDPRHPYTWGLLSAMPDLGTDDERLYTIPGSPPNLLHKVTGDAFAPRNKYALNIDSRLEPPMFKISETHSAATWLLHPKAPKVDMPPELRDRIERMKKEGGIA